jgi:glycosyltransferase involved in cell wall biosynthesis
LILSEWGYPFGGGEAFLHESARTMNELGFGVTWINCGIPGMGLHKQSKIILWNEYTEQQYARDFDAPLLETIISLHNPSIIFCHGTLNNSVSKISKREGIQVISGYHFWTGLIRLGKTGNFEIIKNIHRHSLEPINGGHLNPFEQRYVVSNFMLDVYRKLGGTENLIVLDPIIDTDIVDKYAGKSGGWITQLDVSVGKGGRIFCDLVESLGDRYPFTAVIRDTTEIEITQRLSSLSVKFPKLTVLKYSSVREILQNSNLLILPSLVDETYSRVSEEAVRSGIPILTSNSGNLQYILNGVGAIANTEVSNWRDVVSSIYENRHAAESLWWSQANALRENKENSINIVHLIELAIDKIKIQNIGIFSPDSAQGLGVLTKIIAKSAKTSHRSVHILTYEPYKKNLKDSEFWLDVYPSIVSTVLRIPSTRESVSLEVVLEFIDTMKIDMFIFPEVCWDENWNRLQSIKKLRPNVQILTIPMIETLVKSEIAKLNNYDRTLIVNKFCLNTLTNYDIRNGMFVNFTSPFEGKGIVSVDEPNSQKLKGQIKFLHIGGHNPSIRKQTETVVNEFRKALNYRSDIYLTVTLQAENHILDQAQFHPNIRILKQNLSEAKIIELHNSHDVSIMIPSHEGIGIGFYESISLGIPIVTLDYPLYREVVIEDRSGWILPSRGVPLSDNLMSVVTGVNLIEGALTDFLCNLKETEVQSLKESTKALYIEKFSNFEFDRLINRVIGSKRNRVWNVSSGRATTLVTILNITARVLIKLYRLYFKKILPLTVNQKYTLKQFLFKFDK